MTSGNVQQNTDTCRTEREDYIHVCIYLTLQWNPLRWRPCKCAVRVHRCEYRLYLATSSGVDLTKWGRSPFYLC